MVMKMMMLKISKSSFFSLPVQFDATVSKKKKKTGRRSLRRSRSTSSS